MEYLLGIDIGTSGTKTVLFDTEGNKVASGAAEYPLYSPQNGWAEQDPLHWWNAAVKTIREVLRISGANPADIRGVGLSGQMHGLVMLDSQGKTLRRSILWCDQRTARECEQITEKIGQKRLIEITANPALTGFTAGKILWVRNNEPEIFEQCAHILLPKDYIRYMLTGELATEVSDASGTGLFDVPNRCWSDEVLNRLGIEEALLAKAYESPEITGRISAHASEITGLAVGTIVAGGAGDNAAAAVGTGVVTDGRAFVTIGSSGVVYAHTSRLSIDPQGRVHTFCCSVPGAWHLMGVTQGAGFSLKWFRDNFCNEEKTAAKGMGVDPYDILDREAKRVPLGANRLIYLPYLMGERTPHLDPDCRGVFFGLTAMHTKYDMLRAIMEGVAYSLCDCVQILRGMDAELSRMTATGGGARSELWRQMFADVFDCEIATAASKEGPALGAAILAGVAAGVFSSVEKGCEAVVKTNLPQSPIPENTKRFHEFYGVYRALYPQLKESFKRLSRI